MTLVLHIVSIHLDQLIAAPQLSDSLGLAARYNATYVNRRGLLDAAGYVNAEAWKSWRQILRFNGQFG